MNFFKTYYKEVSFEGDEVKVLCPFHQDTRPSASINTNKNVFHCWVCDLGLSEEQFMARVNGLSVQESYKLMQYMTENQYVNWETDYKAFLWSDEEFISKVEELGISKATMEDLNLGVTLFRDVKFLAIPVFVNGVVIDIRRYNLLKDKRFPKLIANTNSMAGAIIPFDVWKNNDGTTYIMEGEKDMLLARELGLNAITLTGGANSSLDHAFIHHFKDKDVVIVYDNDDAGRKGTQKIANQLIGVAKTVCYKDLSSVCVEKGEDFYDFIKKYNNDLMDFLLLDDIPLVKEDETIEYVTISESLRGNRLTEKLRSVVTVTGDFADSYAIPSVIKATKVSNVQDGIMGPGETRQWCMTYENKKDILNLMEVDAKDAILENKMKLLMGLSSKEKGLSFSKSEMQTVYKCTVVDKNIDNGVDTLELYTFSKMKVGEQYDIEYRLFPHPTRNQKVIGIVDNCVSMSTLDSSEAKVDLLRAFKSEGTIAQRLDKLYQSAKHHVAGHLNFNLWLMTELVFNSILDIDYGGKIRGALDVFILGDTQVGKSETTSKLAKLYNFGQFLSLKTSTTVGLIGGSTKVDGSWCNTIGAIPRQHTKLVIMEEFSGAKPDFIKTMTDIRSSNELRLARASGELKVPCKLRMVTISNPVNDINGNPRFLCTFPNGVIPITELITSAEDIARYDGFLLVPKVEKRINPFDNKLIGEPIPKACYVYKAEWVVSRVADNVKYEEGVESYIWEKAEELNSRYESNFSLFGTTTSLKLARFSVALASLLLNVNSSYENIIVTKDIVDYVVSFLDNIYSSDIFKLDEYKKEFDSYNNFTKEDLDTVQEMYPQNNVVFDFLANQSKTSRSNLRSISGLDGDKFNPIFNKMVLLRLVRLNMDTVYPTEKYRKLYKALNKNFTTSAGLVTNNNGKDYDLNGKQN